MSEQQWNDLRNKIIGLGDQSGRKSYFPELQSKIHDLEAREHNLVTLLNSMLDAVIIITPKGQLLESNAALLKLFLLPNKSTAHQYSIHDYTYNITTELLDQVISETKEGTPQLVEWSMKSPATNQVFDAEISMHSTTWDHHPAIIVTVRDISFRKKIEKSLWERERRLRRQNEQLLKLNQELAKSNKQIAEINDQLRKTEKKAIESDRLKSAFLANMSHEIRTPMNGIVGFASLLAFAENDQDEIRQYISIVNNCSQQLLTIIDDIIDISKIEARQMTINPQVTNINQMLNELLAFYLATGKDEIEMKAIMELPDHQSTIQVDQGRLRQILNNLINNSLKFTNSGHIHFGYKRNHKYLEFFVEDTGIGIPKEQQKHIFKRFRQINDKPYSPHSGTGLGLTISKALVNMMGGKIRVKSDSNTGTTFTFTIPYIHTDEE